MSKVGRGIVLLTALLTLSACGQQAADCGGLEVTDVWVRAAPSASSVVQAGYFEAYNDSDRRVVIKTVNSPDFERVEMHQTVVRDGQAGMVPVDQIEVAGGERWLFEPGGYHIMLFDPRLDYDEGDRVQLYFICGKENARLPITAQVRSSPPVSGAR